MGLPDGLMAAFVLSPHRVIKTHAALGHNTNSFGLRLGVTYSPLSKSVSPYGAFELGHYFSADTPDWMRETAKDAGLKDKTLVRVGYTFINGHLGVRFGSDKVGVYFQGGVSFIAANALVIKPKPNFTPPVDLYRDTSVNLWIASGRVGAEFSF